MPRSPGAPAQASVSGPPSTRGLLVAGEVPLALLYIFGSLLLAFLATWTGLRLGRFVIGDDL